MLLHPLDSSKKFVELGRCRNPKADGPVVEVKKAFSRFAGNAFIRQPADQISSLLGEKEYGDPKIRIGRGQVFLSGQYSEGLALCRPDIIPRVLEIHPVPQGCLGEKGIQGSCGERRLKGAQGRSEFSIPGHCVSDPDPRGTPSLGEGTAGDHIGQIKDGGRFFVIDESP